MSYIKQLEEKYKKQIKELFEDGWTYLEIIAKDINKDDTLWYECLEQEARKVDRYEYR